MTRVEQRGPSLVRPCFWVCQNPRRHVRRYDEVAVQEGQAPTNEVPLLAEAED